MAVKQHVVSMKALLEAGVHFGHRTRRWNPKMKQYIFTERNGIHIIDLQQTIIRLNQAYELVKDTVASGGTVLFVGTKRQAQESIYQEATRCRMPYVNQRWLGGTLTNWRTIRQRIDYLLDIEKQQARGEFARLIKKEALQREREIARLNHRVGGLKEMRRLPNLVFIVDVRRDALAVKEANVLGVPLIAMVDTNCDPDPIDHVIPSNDDAIRAIKLMVSTMANAVLDGQAILSTLEAEEEAAAIEGEEALERYLGPSTLAKIQAADEEEEEEVETAPAVAEEVEAEVLELAEAAAKEAVVPEAEAVVSEAVEEPAQAEERPEEVVEAPAEVEAAEEVLEAVTEAEAAEEALEAAAEVAAEAVDEEPVETTQAEETAEETVQAEETAEEAVPVTESEAAEESSKPAADVEGQ